MLPGVAKLPCSKAGRCHHSTTLCLQYLRGFKEAFEEARRHAASSGVTKLVLALPKQQHHAKHEAALLVVLCGDI